MSWSGVVSSDDVAQRAGGRARGPAASTIDSVLGAAFAVLVAEGVAAITPTRLHQETGVARTTIYRHWPDAAAVVADIVAGATRREGHPELTGDVAEDLRAAVATLTFRLRNRPVRPLLGALMDADGRGNDPTRPSSADYVRGLLAPIREAVEAACERGALVGGADAANVDRLVADLAGPLLTRTVLLGENPKKIDDAFIVADFLARRAA